MSDDPARPDQAPAEEDPPTGPPGGEPAGEAPGDSGDAGEAPRDDATVAAFPETVASIADETIELSASQLSDPSASSQGRSRTSAAPSIAESIFGELDPQGNLVSGVRLRSLGGEATQAKELKDGSARYQIRRKLAEGGMGKVYLAHDRDLLRNVALKVCRSNTDAYTVRFLEESQILGQLGHPNIVPLHDVGLDSTGRLYCTMRLVQGKTLAEVIEALRKGEDDELREQFSLPRRVQVFIQVTQAIAYAHAKGVVHRDLKPANVMLGEHGEVQVLDWGLAKVLDKASVTTGTARDQTMAGQVMGTPGYMAPEQAIGGDVDERADVFALGAILYELLALCRAFNGKSHVELIRNVLADKPVPPRERRPDGNIPEGLERACLSALRADPADRVPSAADLLDAVQSWFDEEADRAKRTALADERATEGRRILEEHRRLLEEVERLEERVKDRARRFESWQSVEEKAELFSAEDEVKAAQEKVVQAASDVVTTLTEALGFDPEHAAARRALAEFYWDQFRDAEHRGDHEQLNVFGRVVAAYDDGQLARELAGDGSLQLVSEPAGAEVELFELVEENLSLIPKNGRSLGTTPVAQLSLPMGTYLVILKKEGYRDVRYPVYISRNRDWEGRVRLLSEDEIGEGYLHVPAGPFVCGGDIDKRVSSPPRTEVELPDYLISRNPVTMGQYLAFVNDLAKTNMEEALKRCPRRPRGDRYVDPTPGGQFKLPPRDPVGNAWELDWPVFGISWFDAVTYTEWLSAREKRTVRLPSADEWEKAARGVDGRWFPWGNRFDASLCNMSDSLRERPAPVGVDEFASDTSVYGLRGAGGNVRDWTSTPVVEGVGEGARETRVVRGGAWINNDVYSHVASTYSGAHQRTFDFIGFRVVAEPKSP
ncbi:MAG: bifunctional serine/threonine-protein kinase/formylglycine-generating enzyme family protein [Acidobacteriota bacterium]